MQVHWGTFGRYLLIAAAMGCVPKPAAQPASGLSLARTDGKPVFAVLPAESAEFPAAARVITERMRRARIKGFDEAQVSKVSLEVVQLSIECVDRSIACLAAVGKELSANQMLFAEIAPGKKKEEVQVTVTLFDVDGKQRKRAAVKVFASEVDVEFGIADVVAEATR